MLGGACLLALSLQGLVQNGQLPLLQMGLALGVIAALLVLDQQMVQRYGETLPQPVGLVVLLVHAVLVELLTVLDGLTYSAIMYLTLPFPAFFLAGKWAGLLVSLGLAGWFTFKFFVLKPGWLTDPDLVNTYVLFLVALSLLTAMAQVVQRERANRQRAEALLRELETSHRQLATSHAQLRQYAEQVAELTLIEERNRVARDIHDSLGHYLTVIGVQLEKALLIVAEDVNELRTTLRTAKRLTDQALTDVRESVGALRQAPTRFTLQPALEALVANLRDAPFQIEVRITGDETRFSRQQLLTLYRAAQEGLTNVHKHAQASHVRLEVDLAEQAALLTLADDGIGFRDTEAKHTIVSAGVGLQGVHERLELVGGRLTIACPPEGGTRLSVLVPCSNPLTG